MAIIGISCASLSGPDAPISRVAAVETKSQTTLVMGTDVWA
jgi:hypothetical protein